MITINLKEIFSVDSQTDLASKLNFNFNQLLALGFGETGPAGPIGPIGPAGPVGPIGETGAAGSQIYSYSLGSVSETVPNEPIDALTGDYHITGDVIYKKITTGSPNQWQVISDFYEIFGNIASAGTSTWQLGLIDPNSLSRLLTPIKSFSGIDRISVQGSSGNFATNVPNWTDPATNYANSQISLYNFDPNTTKVYTDTVGGENGYGVSVGTSRLGVTGASDSAFPYSSLLSLYSYYNGNAASAEPDQFQTINGSSASGYRHQLELGSVDDMAETIVSTSGDAQYVISPTWQNLRVRKYRTPSTLPGGSIINTDFNLNSSDSTTRPSLNSRFTWRINKKSSAASQTGTNIEFSLAGSAIETSAQALTGISVDGLHLRGGSVDSKLAIGFDPSNNGSTIKNAVVSSDSANSINTVVFNNLGIRVTNPSSSSTSAFSPTGLSSNRSFTIETTGSQANVTISSGSVGKSIFMLSPNPVGGSVYIGNSANGTGSNWASTSGYAIKVTGNRLGAGLPFPTSTSATPVANSLDPNVLDEYCEITFSPDVGVAGTIPTAPAATIQGPPAFGDKIGRFVKIGSLVQFSIQFSISDWQALFPAQGSGAPATVGLVSRDTKMMNYGNISTSGTNPFASLTFGNEPYYLYIRNIPDHFPILYNTVSSVPFTVNITSSVPGEPGLRGNPFYYSWGGSGTGGNAGTTATSGTSSRVWAALDPASVTAKMTTYSDAGTTRPQIQLYGYRRVPFAGAAATTPVDAVSPVQCKVSIYDFLRPFVSNSTAGKKVFVTITGTYFTNHQTADQTVPGQTTPQDPTPDTGVGQTE